MAASKYLWGKTFQIGLIILLTTLDVTIYGAEHVEGIVGIIPWVRSTFIIGSLITLIGLLGLSKTCRSNRELKLMFGRALYLPTLVAIAINVLTKGITISLIMSTQFILSILLFILGYFISCTA